MPTNSRFHLIGPSKEWSPRHNSRTLIVSSGEKDEDEGEGGTPRGAGKGDWGGGGRCECAPVQLRVHCEELPGKGTGEKEDGRALGKVLNSSLPFDGQPERLRAEELEHHRGAEAAHGVEAQGDQVAREVGAAQEEERQVPEGLHRAQLDLNAQDQGLTLVLFPAHLQAVCP